MAFWVSTGARASELLGATWRDADPGQQLIAVIRKGTRHLQQLPASPDAFVWLRLYQAQLQGLVPAGPDDPLWWTLRRPFRQLGYHAAYRMFHRASASLGANWSPHDLRHLAAYRMTRDPGMPLADVQWVLGHAQLSTTQLYLALLQQRARAECTSYCRFLRRLAQELRQAQVSSLSELPVQDEPVRRSLVNSLLAHLGRACADPRTEIAKDRWDLTVLGHHGWLAFTGISQRWLREAVKGWAAHDLPRRRGKQAGARLHEIVGATVRLSATLRAGRHDQGENQPGSAAPTSRRSCTGWPSCPPTGSCLLTAASRPARTRDGS